MFVRKLWSLALISLEFVGAAFESLEQETASFEDEEWYQKVGLFLRYFESTWVQRRDRHGQLLEGRIPKQYWNNHDAASVGQATTTSSLEAWNRRTTDAAEKYPKKSFWYLLYHFKVELGQVSHQQAIRLSQGVDLVQTSTATQRKKIEGIKEALRTFNSQEISNSLARVANSIDQIQLDDLAFDGV